MEIAASYTYKISVIIPVYNCEDYLARCIESVLNQPISLEIVIVNDGSTDTSEKIINSYVQRCSNITAVHTENGGASAARNIGLNNAKGEYIVFVDSDDWIVDGSLALLYNAIKKYKADVLMANLNHTSDGKAIYSFGKHIPENLKYRCLTGKKYFSKLMELGQYYPMFVNYIYSHVWLKKTNLKFHEDIIHEDELWSPLVFYSCEKIVITDIDYYCYEKRKGSVMCGGTMTEKHIASIFYVCKELYTHIEKHESKEAEHREFKSWLYVNLLRMYLFALYKLDIIQNSDFTIPEHYIQGIEKQKSSLVKQSQKKFNHYLKKIHYEFSKYEKWRSSIYVNTSFESGTKKIILFYNLHEELNEYIYTPLVLPNKYTLTSDRKYFNCADVVIFYIPELGHHMASCLHKKRHQIWVAWNDRSKASTPWFFNSKISELFDISISHQLNSEIPFSYSAVFYKNYRKSNRINSEKNKKICCILSRRNYQKKCIEYIQKLSKYIDIDFYECFDKSIEHITLLNKEEKLKIYSKYTFSLSLEDAIEENYVTNTFYDPLLMKSIPIYWGAPNIEQLAPGKNCYINITNFQEPEQLATYINNYIKSDKNTQKHQLWRKEKLQPYFLNQLTENSTNPLIRLINHIDSMA